MGSGGGMYQESTSIEIWQTPSWDNEYHLGIQKECVATVTTSNGQKTTILVQTLIVKSNSANYCYGFGLLFWYEPP